MCSCGPLCEFLSTFCASTGPSVNFRQLYVHPRDDLSTLRAAAGPSVNFCQLFVHLRELLSTFCTAVGTSVNTLSHFCAAAGPFINFPCLPRTIRQIPSDSGTFCELLSTFRAAMGLFINFCLLLVRPLDLQPTSFNFRSVCGTFHHLSVRPRDHPST